MLRRTCLAGRLCSLHFDSPPLTVGMKPIPPFPWFSPLTFRIHLPPISPLSFSTTWRVCGQFIHSRFSTPSPPFYAGGSYNGHHQLPMPFTNIPRPFTPCIYAASPHLFSGFPVQSLISLHQHLFLIRIFPPFLQTYSSIFFSLPRPQVTPVLLRPFSLILYHGFFLSLKHSYHGTHFSSSIPVYSFHPCTNVYVPCGALRSPSRSQFFT